MTYEPVLEVTLKHIDVFHVAGLSGRYDPSTFVHVNELWAAFVRKAAFAGRLGDGETCGVFRNRDPAAQSFEHLAGARVRAGQHPDGLEVWTLPAGEYLVFRQLLQEGELHPQVAAAQAEIWERRVLQSGRALAGTPDFQIYPVRFTVGVGGWLEYCLPLEPRPTTD